MAIADLFEGGGGSITRHGTLARRTSSAEDEAETHTRASDAYFIERDGVLKIASQDVPRVEWVDLDGDGVRETPGLLLEGAGSNLVLQSEDLSTTWADIGTPTLGTAHTASGVSLDLLGDDAAGAAEGQSQVFAFTADAVKGISAYVKEGTSSPAGGSEIIIRDTSAGEDRLQATVTWAAGVPSVAMTTGTELASPELTSDGVYRLHLATTAVTAANTNQIEVYAGRKGTVGDTGNVYVGGFQAEDALVPTSYTKTTTGASTRAADVFYFDWPWAPTDAPLTILLDARELGTLTNGNTAIHIGSSTAATDPRLLIESTGTYYQALYDDGTTVLTATLAAAPTHGQDFKLRVVLDPITTGLTIGQSIEGAAETTNTDATTATTPSEFADERLYVNSAGSSDTGSILVYNLKAARGSRALTYMDAL